MKISIFGLGYVGCVAAACLARDGHSITGVDVNPQKLELLAAGCSPVVEPGLDEMIGDAVGRGNLRVSLDSRAATHNTDISLICVGTPSNANGSLKLEYIENVCREIGEALATKVDYHLVIVRSTVLPDTVEQRLIPILEGYSGRRAGIDFGICMNPEFLREGTAVHDYDHPSFVVVGELDQRSGDVVQGLYQAIEAPVIRTTIRTAEMVKFTCNAFHALKVVFANEIGNLCKLHNIDGQEVMEIFGQDRVLNISTAYLQPGFAFGGSCLPKDLRALIYRAKELDADCDVLRAILPSNQKQVDLGIQLVERSGCKRVGILGMSFKADTDDLRESPAVLLTETLLGRGYQVRVYDEKVQLSHLVGSNKSFLEQELPHIASLMCTSIEQLISVSDILVITNGSRTSSQIPRLMNGRQKLIDLVGTLKTDSSMLDGYEGICW